MSLYGSHGRSFHWKMEDEDFTLFEEEEVDMFLNVLIPCTLFMCKNCSRTAKYLFVVKCYIYWNVYCCIYRMESAVKELHFTS